MVVLVGAGIGVTPFASVLADMVNKLESNVCEECGHVGHSHLATGVSVEKIYFRASFVSSLTHVSSTATCHRQQYAWTASCLSDLHCPVIVEIKTLSNTTSVSTCLVSTLVRILAPHKGYVSAPFPPHSACSPSCCTQTGWWATQVRPTTSPACQHRQQNPSGTVLYNQSFRKPAIRFVCTDWVVGDTSAPNYFASTLETISSDDQLGLVEPRIHLTAVKPSQEEGPDLHAIFVKVKSQTLHDCAG